MTDTERSIFLTRAGIERVAENVRQDSWYTRTVKTGILYSNCTVDATFVPVALKTRQTRNITPDSFNTDRWVRDAFAGIYRGTIGNEAVTLSLPRDEMLEIFFCPFQLVRSNRINDNHKNPLVSSFVDIEDPWYGNILVLKTVAGQVVDMDPAVDNIGTINTKVGEFARDYLKNWRDNKNSANYGLVVSKKLHVFLELYR